MINENEYRCRVTERQFNEPLAMTKEDYKDFDKSILWFVKNCFLKKVMSK